jgi:peroxiredoxin (alkyl hydroperoxide reductase subunit C)
VDEGPLVGLGQPVPDFELTAYDPTMGDFRTIGLEQLKADGKWTILFFYPADFTFV